MSIIIIITLIFVSTSYFIKYRNVPLDSKDKIFSRLKCLSKMTYHGLYKYHNIIPSLFISSLIIGCIKIYYLNPFYYLLLLLPTYIQYVVMKSRKSGQYAYSLSKGLDIGFINPETVSLHLSENNLWVMKKIYKSELLDVLKELGVKNIVFKSHLLHTETLGHKKKINFINKFMCAKLWKKCTKNSKETNMDFTTFFAIQIRIIHSRISICYYRICYLFSNNSSTENQLTVIKSSIPKAITKKEYQLYYSI